MRDGGREGEWVAVKWRTSSTSRRWLPYRAAKKERIDGESSISNQLGMCFVANLPREEPALREMDHLLTRRYTFRAPVSDILRRARAKWDVSLFTFKSL